MNDVQDVKDLLQPLVDGARLPVAIAEMEQRSRRRRRHRVLAGSASLAVVIGLVAVAVSSNDERTEVAAGQDDTSTTQIPASTPTVSVEPAAVGDISVDVSPLSAADNGWLQHSLTLTNTGDQVLYVDDTSTSTFIAGTQLLVGDGLCGYGYVEGAPSVLPGTCALMYQGATLEPGASRSYTVTVWRDLPGMEALTTDEAAWSRLLRFDSVPYMPPDSPPADDAHGTEANLVIRYSSLQAQPAEPPVATEATAPRNIVAIGPNDIIRVEAEMALPSQQATLQPPPSSSAVEADLTIINAHLEQIPEEISGITPTVYLGLMTATQDTAPPQLVIAVIYHGVMSRPVGGPPGAPPVTGPSPAVVTALYDATTGEQLRLIVAGCPDAIPC